jgi:hypothetical protein
LQSVTLSGNLEVISQYAFESCLNLSHVDIPEGVKNIGPASFRYCSALTSVTLSESVDTISTFAFAQCVNLSAITLPEKLSVIGYHAFESCTSLTSFDVPDGLSFLGIGAFIGCSSLERVSMPGVPLLMTDVFVGAAVLAEIKVNACEPITVEDESRFVDDEVYANSVVYVPVGSVDAYRNAIGWRRFAHIEEDATLNGTNIRGVTEDSQASSPYYNLLGQRVHQLRKGAVYVRNAKKVYF